MKQFKQSVLTTTLALTLCASLLPATAQPLVNKPSHTTGLPSKLTLSTPLRLSEEFNKQTPSVHKHNEFFEAAIVFNDKLQQLLSYFSTRVPQSAEPSNNLNCQL